MSGWYAFNIITVGVGLGKSSHKNLQNDVLWWTE